MVLYGRCYSGGCMDSSQEKIVAKFDNGLLDHFFFTTYIGRDELNEIDQRVTAGKSDIVGFYKGGELLFCAVYDYEKNCLHVRQVVGFFGKLHDVLDVFSQALAKFLGVKNISFTSSRRAVAKWAVGNEYVLTPKTNEFLKVMH